MIKKVLAAAGNALAILLITATLCEIGFRVFNAISPAFFFPSSSYNRFRGKPGAPDFDFTLNSRGFKDLEFAPVKAPGTCRILGLGDSFVFAAVPYRYCFLTVLEDTLNGGARRYEVINMGIPSTGPPQYLAILGTEGLPLAPDLVLCFFFIGNDFTEEVKGDGVFSSYLLAFLRYVLKIAPAVTGIEIHGKAIYRDDTPTMQRDVFMRIEKARCTIFLKTNPAFGHQLDRAVAPLLKMQQLSARAGAAFAVVIMPDEAQVSPELQAELLAAAAPLHAADLDIELPNRLLRERLQRAGITYLDLLGDFASQARSRRLYIPRNTHWNIAGNALAAKRIAAWLHASGLIATCGEAAPASR